ncbi:MAG: hypothetical protein PHQ19_08210 [Candidatus Krumholzibacteria bacterium]|nr:hypothetical protein [Candidatus Krumholzibacteria bacterium]
MRHAIAIVLTVMMLAASSAARASDAPGFSAWASGKSGELDRQWLSVTGRWSPAAGSPDGISTGSRLGRPGERSRTGFRGAPAPSLPAPGIGADWTRADLPFTTYDDGMLLLNSTRKRPGPSRGVSMLRSPARATRGDTGAGRTAFSRKAEFTHVIHTKGRNAGDRISAPLHNRITKRSMTRTPSSLHGASRARRQPSRGRW